MSARTMARVMQVEDGLFWHHSFEVVADEVQSLPIPASNRVDQAC